MNFSKLTTEFIRRGSRSYSRQTQLDSQSMEHQEEHIMPQYSIASNGRLWHVMKDGRFFCMATSQKMAESICASMGNSATPSVNEFRAWHVAIGSAEPSKN